MRHARHVFEWKSREVTSISATYEPCSVRITWEYQTGEVRMTYLSNNILVLRIESPVCCTGSPVWWFWFLSYFESTVTWLTTDGVWIGHRIYWTLTFVNYKKKRQSRSHNSKDHCNYSTNKAFTVFTSRYLATAPNGGHSPSPGFPKCSRPQISASHLSQIKHSSSRSQSYFTTGGLPSCHQALWDSWPLIFKWTLAVIVIIVLVTLPRHG
jgi:hypothetical protein